MPYIGNIKVKGVKKGKPKLVAGKAVIPFTQNEKSLKNLEYKNKFIKGVENLVRSNMEYDRYKAYLAGEKGLDFCQVHPYVRPDETSKRRIPIEMHHGPILTLYDYCTIVTNALIKREYDDITTFTVAEIVLEEHRLNHIQVVMLCENCHDIFHSGGYIYINPKQAWGNLKGFFKNWGDGIDKDMRKVINENLEIARHYESNDNGILDARPGKVWKR